MRWAATGRPAAAIRRWLSTAPFFCARPVMSKAEACRPSRRAAIATSAAAVTTPVPPMPVIMILTGSTPRGAFGAGGRSEGANHAGRDGPGLRGSAPAIGRKDGQKRLAQLKRFLQTVRASNLLV